MGVFLPESLDIIKYIDENFGASPIVHWDHSKTEIRLWLTEAQNYTYYLAMPRWIQMPLKEFETQRAKDYFQRKKEAQSIGSFEVALKETPQYKDLAERALKKLESLLEPQGRFYSQETHIDDFHLFASLRSLTAVQNLKWPPKIKAYIENLSTKSNINTFWNIAI